MGDEAQDVSERVASDGTDDAPKAGIDPLGNPYARRQKWQAHVGFQGRRFEDVVN